jgi:hypothetical protein
MQNDLSGMRDAYLQAGQAEQALQQHIEACQNVATALAAIAGSAS